VALAWPLRASTGSTPAAGPTSPGAVALDPTVEARLLLRREHFPDLGAKSSLLLVEAVAHVPAEPLDTVPALTKRLTHL
jgi:hypothetical protein